MHKSEQDSRPKAFLSHGKYPDILALVERFLIELDITPVVVEKQPDVGPSLDEKVRHYMQQCVCTIVLATPDDKVERYWQPRQNVIKEAAMAQEMMPEKVIYMKEKRTRLPSLVNRPYIQFELKRLDYSLVQLTSNLSHLGLIGQSNVGYIQTPVGPAPWLTNMPKILRWAETNTLAIDSISYDYTVSDGDLVVNSRRYKGRNQGTEPCTECRTYAGGDNLVGDDRFLPTLHAYDMSSNGRRELRSENVREMSDDYAKAFRGLFTVPIAHGEPFDIEFTYVWPGCLSRNPDGIFFPLSTHKSAVGFVDIRITFSRKLKSWSMQEVVGKDKFVSDAVSPVELVEDDKYAYHWSKNNPRNDYFFHFIR